MDYGGGFGEALSTASSTASRKACEGAYDQFPAGLRVLVVDDDPICLMILEKMLRNCLYEVTTCPRAVVALSMLRERRGGFDLVISDVYMPDMDGFKLLEHIGLEMDLPVIMMSADDGKDVVMKGVTHGACDYLIKPVRIEAIKNIWQHVVRKKRNELKDLEQSVSVEDSDAHRKLSEDADYASSVNEGSWKNSKKRKDERDEEDEGEDREDSSTLKKPRVVWSPELHQQFVAAVNQLTIDKAVPKKILDLMNVPGLTRENVASHLQKYRSYLRRLSGVRQHQGGVSTSFGGTPEANCSISSLDRLDLHKSFVASGQIPPQKIATLQGGFGRTTTSTEMGIFLSDQVNHFANISKLKFGSGEQLNQEQMNLLHGLSTSMEPRQLNDLHQSFKSFGNLNLQVSEGTSGLLCLPTSLTSSSSHGDIVCGHQSSSLMMQMAQQQQHPNAQNQSQIQSDISRELQLQGQLMKDNAGRHDLKLPSSIRQQILSNEIVDQVFRRNETLMNGRGMPLGGSCLNNSSYIALSQASSVDFPFSHSIELPGSGFSLASTDRLSSSTSMGMYREAIPTTGGLEGLDSNTSLKGSIGFVPSYNHPNELHHIQGWELENSNLAQNATQLVNSQVSNPDFSLSVLGHQSFIASQNNGLNGGSQSSGNEIVTLRAEHECGNPKSIAQCHNNLLLDSSFKVRAESVPHMRCKNLLLTKNFAQDDLMNELFKQRDNVEQGEAEVNFDGYSMDNIPV